MSILKTQTIIIGFQNRHFYRLLQIITNQPKN